MYVRKKYMVQKSFRIDKQVENDISVLAELTGRSQNELVNCAISEFLQDNKERFLEIAVLEHFEFEFDKGKCLPSDKFESFELGGLRVELKILNGEEIKISMRIHDGDKVFDEYDKVFEEYGDDAEEYLKNLSVHIDRESEDVKEYLERRTDYADYVKVRK